MVKVACLVFALLSLTAWTTSLQAQIPVNQDPPPRVHYSPSITIEPVSGNLVSAYVDDPRAINGFGAGWSQIGSGLWTDSNLLGPPPTGWLGNIVDTSIAADGAGAAYACFAQFDALVPNVTEIYVYPTVNGGLTFGPAAVVSTLNGPAGSIPLEIKPKVEADDYAVSPFFQNVYVVWERDLINWANSDCMFSSSPPGGVAWAPAAPVNDNPGAEQVLWPDLAVGSDGRVHFAWLDSPLFQTNARIQVDQTATASPPFGVDVTAVNFCAVPMMLTDVNWVPTYSAMSYPSIEVDPSNPNRIGVVYAGDPDAGIPFERRLDTGDQPAGSALAWLNDWQPGVGACPGWVYSSWADYRNGPLGDIYFRRCSTPTGSWVGEVNITLNHPNTHAIGYGPPAMATSGNGVFMTWGVQGPDSPPTPVPPFIHFAGSLNNGQNWLPVVHVDPLGTGQNYNLPVIAASGNNVCIAWANFQSSSSVLTIYANRSIDGGMTWQNPEIVVATRTAVEHGLLSIAGTGNNFYIVWDERFGIAQDRDVYVAVSSDAGLTWASPIKLDSLDTLSTNWSQNAKICCTAAGDVYVTWYDEWPGSGAPTNWDPTFAVSNDFGVTWSTEVRLNDGVGYGSWPPPAPAITCNGNVVNVIYQSDRLNLAGVYDIYVSRSTDGGATWPPTDTRLDTGDAQEANTSDMPQITTSGNNVYAVYRDDRNGMTDVYANWSTDGGATWQPADMRLDIGNPAGASPVRAPCVAADGAAPCYVWEDGRNLPMPDIYCYQPIGNGPDEGDIFYIESLNGGITWSAPLRVNDDATTNDQSHPWLDFKPNGTVDVVWNDKRNDGQDQIPEVYFAALLPGATAFTANVAVSPAPIVPPPFPGNWFGDYIWVEVDQTDAHIVYEETMTDMAMGDIHYAIIPNPIPTVGFATHNINNLIATVTSQGILGFMDGSQSEGEGLVYPAAAGINQLYLGGLWIGLDETYVANRDYDADPAKEFVVSVDPPGYPEIETGGDVDQLIRTRYTDGAAAAPQGLFVTQESWAFASPPYDDFVIIRYQIQNEAAAMLTDLYAGVFLDLDLGNPWDDQGWAIPDHQLVYMTDIEGNHVGVAKLEGPDPVPVANLTLVHNPTFVHPQDYVLDPDKMAFLQAADPAHQLMDGSIPDEYSVLASAGPFSIEPGETIEVVFALVGGESEGDILFNVEAAQEILNTILLSGAPDEAGLPSTPTQLRSNVPNPFNPSTRIRFQLAQPEHVKLAIYDVSGRLVKTLADEPFDRGTHSLEWDGGDAQGRCTASGVYFCRFEAGSYVGSRKLLMVK